MKIGGLQKTTLIDYPKELACIVFLKGCNFRCPFCYSRELVFDEGCLDISEKDFFDFLDKRKGQLDACVICGGEPTIYGDKLIDFIFKIKEKGYKVKLDTNGSNPEVVKKLIAKELIDYIAMDVKAPFEKYKEVSNSNIDVNKIRESIELIKNSGTDYEFRTTLVPELLEIEDIKEIVKQIIPAKKYYVQNFRNEKETIDPKFSQVEAFKEEDIQKVIDEIKDNFKDCYLR